MTPDRRPGSRFLGITSRLLPPALVERVFLPAVADLQGEWREATTARRRAWVRVRGGCSLAVLTLVTLLDLRVAWHALVTMPRSGGWLLVLLVPTFYAATWPLFGGFMVATLTLGTIVACAVRGWNVRHPSNDIEARRQARTPTGDINLSAIPVGGDIAGLMFAAGSVAIVVIGLPGLWWYFAAVAVGSVIAAVAVAVWHGVHHGTRPTALFR